MISSLNALLRFLLLLASLMLPATAAMAVENAAENAALEIDPTKTDVIIETLEDPEARNRLIEQLKALNALQQEPAAAPRSVDELSLGLVEIVSRRANALARTSVELSSAIVDLPDLTGWLTDQMTDETYRSYWIDLLLKLAVILGGSIIGYRLTRYFLNPTIDRFYQERPDGLVTIVPLALLRGALRLIPVLAFAAVGYGLLTLLGNWNGDATTILGRSLVDATIVCLVLVVAARTVLAPSASGLRLISLADEHARYVFHWIKRFIYLIAYSYVVAQNDLVLEIPDGIYGGIKRALGLVVVSMLIFLVLSNRKPVAHWLRGNGHADSDHVMRVLGRCRRLVADIWPVFAIFYIVSTYLIWALSIPGGFSLLFRGGVLTTFLLAIARPLAYGAERALGEALAARVAEDRALDEVFTNDFLPGFLAEATASSGSVSTEDYAFVVGPGESESPGELARAAAAEGVSRIQVESQQSATEARTGRRRTRFYFDAAQLEALDQASTAGGTTPEGQFLELTESELFSILGLTDRVTDSGGPVEVTREDELFDAFLAETREETCARELFQPTGTQPAPTPDPPDEADPGPAEADDVLTRLSHTIQDVRSPLDALTGGGTGDGIASSIRDFAIPVGPADEPRVFDFSTLDVAFDDVWQTVVDARLEPLARALHIKSSRVLKDSVVVPSDLADYRSLTKTLGAVRTATQNAAPSIAFFRNSGRGPHAVGADSVLTGDLQLPPSPPPPPPSGPDKDLPEAPGGEVFLPPEEHGGQVDADAAPEALIDQINAILREPHAFTSFGADARSKAVNFGLLVGYRHIMTPVTYQVGDLIKSITLAPNESREYTSRTVTTRKRAEKEVLKHSVIRRDELAETNRAETEIVRKALAKTNFSLTSDGTYNVGFSKGSAKTASGRDGETNSSEVKKSFREAIIKASGELRQERNVDISFEESLESEETMTGRIENPNNELTLTCLFFELQRRFRVNETIQKATPVILVAQEVPSPDQINNVFLVRYAWIIRRALLDDGFEPALDYVQGPIVGERLQVIALAETLAAHRRQVQDLTTQLQALEEQAGRRYEALVQAVKDRISEESAEESDGFFADIGDSLFGGGQTTETASLREEAARDAEQRAATQAKEMAIQLQRSVNALNEATAEYNKANRRYQSMDLEVARLRLHVKEHILHYMQAIWIHEVEDQRFLRLYQQPVPQFVREGGEDSVYRRLADSAGISRVQVDLSGSTGSAAVERRTAVDFELVPSIEVLPQAFDRPLVEVADPSRLLGFLGNYMVFPMRESNALTDLMLNPYIDEGLRLLDPHDPGNITRPQFAEYVCRLRERLSDEDFETIREDLSERYRELLLSTEYAGDEIVVPSGALYIEALPGSTPLLESFKLAHRALDLVTAQEEARKATIENLRLASRLIEGDLADPETDARYDFFGAPGVVAPQPGAGGSGENG